MSLDKMKVTLGGKAIEISVYRDQATTRRLVKEVNKRLAEVEKKSSRIDTQAFALEVAISLAGDLEESQKSLDEESKVLFKELDTISGTIDTLVREFRIES